jgi:hypothetical protein
MPLLWKISTDLHSITFQKTKEMKWNISQESRETVSRILTTRKQCTVKPPIQVSSESNGSENQTEENFKWNEFIIQIIDLGSTQLEIKYRKPLNQGILNGGSTVNTK